MKRSFAQVLSSKVEEVARALKDCESSNRDLLDERQRMIERSKETDRRLQVLLDENEQL